MRKTMTVAMAVVALTMAGCQRRTIVQDPILPPAQEAPPMVAPDPLDSELDLVELPAAQAALIAQAGSDTVYFGTDEHMLDMAARTTLAAQARWLLANPAVRASIEGHADERGTREYNLALGERRANAARDFLMAQGVPAHRLTVISWGKERPVAPGAYEAAWAQNRRAATVIVR
ncbi:MAG TPA: peptidoglycan-associated lipoprotein Pal [Sphingomicrobium sp.]|nr:peptidoglycan-associated lipoprotein Pal [Sphingomicrobium sp.]